MRDIIFRGKRVDNGEWVEGYFAKSDGRINNGMCYILPEANNFRHSDGNASVIGNFVSVDPATVWQYTGLTDKNGKRIFEGDILSINGNVVSQVIAKVFYSRGAFRTDAAPEFDGEEPLSYWLAWDCDFEIIGNTHDNPELSIT